MVTDWPTANVPATGVNVGVATVCRTGGGCVVVPDELPPHPIKVTITRQKTTAHARVIFPISLLANAATTALAVDPGKLQMLCGTRMQTRLGRR
jgi:hypothetical protein